MTGELMNKKKLIEAEVEKTLQCFDQPEKIESSPFFFTRVQAAINALEKKETESGISSIFENVLRPAFIGGIVLINLITAGFTLSRQDTRRTTKSQVIYSFAEEYAFTQNDYDILKMNEVR